MGQYSRRLSIIIGCHGKTDYFADTLDSFVKSPYHFKNAEILICDDASPAGGDGDTAREYAHRYPGLIRVLRNERNEGANRVYHKLWENSVGEYIMPFDSDDIFLNFDIDRSMAFLDSHLEFAASFGKKRLFDSQRGDLVESHGGDYSVFALSFNPRVTHNAMLIRSDDLKESGGYLPKCFRSIFPAGPDIAMWVGLGLKKKMLFEDEYRALYRIHPEQHISVKAQRYAQDYRQMQRELLEDFPDLWRSLYERREMRITPELKIPAVVLLGVLFRNAKSDEEAFYYLDTAMRIMPEDYAILEYKIKLLLRLGRSSEALALGLLMLSRHGGSYYVESVAYELIEQALQQQKVDQLEVRKIRAMVVEHFFRMTPEQRQKLDAVKRS